MQNNTNPGFFLPSIKSDCDLVYPRQNQINNVSEIFKTDWILEKTHGKPKPRIGVKELVYVWVLKKM